MTSAEQKYVSAIYNGQLNFKRFSDDFNKLGSELNVQLTLYAKYKQDGHRFMEYAQLAVEDTIRLVSEMSDVLENVTKDMTLLGAVPPSDFAEKARSRRHITLYSAKSALMESVVPDFVRIEKNWTALGNIANGISRSGIGNQESVVQKDFRNAANDIIAHAQQALQALNEISEAATDTLRSDFPIDAIANHNEVDRCDAEQSEDSADSAKKDALINFINKASKGEEAHLPEMTHQQKVEFITGMLLAYKAKTVEGLKTGRRCTDKQAQDVADDILQSANQHLMASVTDTPKRIAVKDSSVSPGHINSTGKPKQVAGKGLTVSRCQNAARRCNRESTLRSSNKLNDLLASGRVDNSNKTVSGPYIQLYSSSGNDEYRYDGWDVGIENGTQLYLWHVDKDVTDESDLPEVERQPLAYFRFDDNRWFFANLCLSQAFDATTMEQVQLNWQLELRNGTQILFGTAPSSRLAVFRIPVAVP